MFLASVCVFITTYNLILPAISVEKDKADSVSGLYLEDAEEIDENQYTHVDPAFDNVVTDVPVVQRAPDEDHEKSSDITELYASGDAFEIFVIYDEKAQIPDEAYLEVEEIMPDSGVFDSGEVSIYDEYLDNTLNTLGLDAGLISYARIFDISIVKDGEKIQPAEGGSVSVRIELADSSSDSLNVVHFPDDSEEGEQVLTNTESSENGAVVEFETDSFSVYSIVDAPEPVHFEPYKISSVGEIEENTVYKLSYGSPEKYFTSTLNNKGCLNENPNSSNAAEWYFEKAGADGSTFYIYTLIDGVKKYIHQKSSGSVELNLADTGTAFILSEAEDKPGTFIIKHGTADLWLQHSGGGGGIRFYNAYDNLTNARIFITNIGSAELQNDPYILNGKTFGIAYNDNSTSAAAMMAEKVTNQNRLMGLDMLIRTDVLGNSGNLLVAENSDIQEWTFESIEKDKYYIKTTVDGTEKFLRINNANVSLVDDKTSASAIQAIPGTDENSGKWHFTVGNYSLNYTGSSANSFNAAGSNNATWLNLVEKSTLTEDDFVEYSARKISANDDILSATEKDDNGDILADDEGNPVYRSEKAKVVIYTRVWNENTKKYEFYAVDHDGSLVRVYESGDQINWVGDHVNSALWEFTEYTNSDGTPSYFYELENTAYQGTYLVPQSGGIISHQPVGINLNGRREGFDYSSIVAWDDDAYAYSGLKVVRDEDGSLRVVTGSLDEAADFHFAVIRPPVEEADPTTTVATVDNEEFGISIKMIDFNNRIVNNRDSVQTSYLGTKPWDAAHAYDTETGLFSPISSMDIRPSRQIQKIKAAVCPGSLTT